ncbi:MaoC/PaaZ C-terminal domain-containing protein [Streptomyces shenzhenensis]|uniref:MaoC/PaaZ C-terminal domain-containing protein n=1 Tax=Streptomyces shenzhenensis TaxID=943815 RepID=UPI0033EDF1C9
MTHTGATRPAVHHFEDFHAGQTFTSGERLVTAADLETFAALSGDTHPLHTDPAYAAETGFGAPVLHGPFGLAVFFGLYHDLGLATDAVIGLLDTDWKYRKPIYVGDTLHFHMTITGCRRTSSRRQGVVRRQVRLLNQRDEVVQEGSTSVLVRARTDGPDPAHLAFATLPWGKALAALLGSDTRFTASLGSWDGTIGLRCDDREVQLRIYKGQIIDTARRVPHGATFTLCADGLTWADLVTGETNDYMRRAIAGQFTVTGDGYEYLRLNKALFLLFEHARRLACEGSLV